VCFTVLTIMIYSVFMIFQYHGSVMELVYNIVALLIP